MTDKIAPPSKRLVPPHQRTKSKFAGMNPNDEREKALRFAELEKSRDKLYALVGKLSVRLNSQTLAENMSTMERDEQSKLPQIILEEAKILNQRNLNEGYDVVLASCLHTLLMMKDRFNDLKYQNFILKEEIESLKKGKT